MEDPYGILQGIPEDERQRWLNPPPCKDQNEPPEQVLDDLNPPPCKGHEERRPRAAERGNSRARIRNFLIKLGCIDIVERDSLIALHGQVEKAFVLTRGEKRAPKLPFIFMKIFTDFRGDPERAALCDVPLGRATRKKYEAVWPHIRDWIEQDAATPARGVGRN